MKLPSLKPQKIAVILKRLGFNERLTKGGHRVYIHSDGRRTLISFHPKPLSRIELKTILKQIRMTEDEFHELL